MAEKQIDIELLDRHYFTAHWPASTHIVKHNRNLGSLASAAQEHRLDRAGLLERNDNFFISSPLFVSSLDYNVSVMRYIDGLIEPETIMTNIRSYSLLFDIRIFLYSMLIMLTMQGYNQVYRFHEYGSFIYTRQPSGTFLPDKEADVFSRSRPVPPQDSKPKLDVGL